MDGKIPTLLRTGAAGLFIALAAGATIVPQLSFEELTDSSELVVSGKITRAWAAWDGEHKYIWTHYELAVASTPKGNPGAMVEFAEPGGAMEDRVTLIEGTVTYRTGESVVVFLSRMPNGYLRTTGWAQGKYALDAGNRLHATAFAGAETLDLKTGKTASSSLRSLDGIALNDLKLRIAARRPR